VGVIRYENGVTSSGKLINLVSKKLSANSFNELNDLL